jgi:hypothetical protein
MPFRADGGGYASKIQKEVGMLALLLLLLIVALLFGGGFVVQWLFIVAVVLAVIWLIGFFAHGPQARWYRW